MNLKDTLLAIAALLVIGAATVYFLPPKDSSTEWKGSNVINSGEGAPPGSIHNLPVPEGVAAARAHLAQRLEVSENQILILTAYEREWPDACLGLAAKDEFCAQVIISGYEVTMLAKGGEYVYRTNLNGTVVRAQN